MDDRARRYPTPLFRVVASANLDSLAPKLSAFCRRAGMTRSEGHWQWSCLENPGGTGATAVALLGGRLVGMVGSTYLRFNRGGRPAVASLVNGLVTLPSERSWGTLMGLLHASGERAAQDGVAFGYAFLVPSVAPLNRRLGARVIGRVPVYAGFLDLPRLLRARGWPRPMAALACAAQPFLGTRIPDEEGSQIEVHPVEEEFGREFDALWKDAVGACDVCAVRDGRYLNWRYVRHPEFDYRCAAAYRRGRPEGVVVYRAVPDRSAAYITELLARGSRMPVLRSLLRHALLDLSSMGIGLVTACFPARSHEARLLRRTGFQSWATRLWDLSLCVITAAKGDRPELDMGRWYFSLGDWFTQ